MTNERTQPATIEPFECRELFGVHKQPQEDKQHVGVLAPTGRLSIKDCRQIDLADKCSDGKVRLAVEQNFILLNIEDDLAMDLLTEDTLNDKLRLKVNPGFIKGNVVSCTVAQFCGLELIENFPRPWGRSWRSSAL